MFHLGWFVGYGYGVQSWNETWSGRGGTEWVRPDLYVDTAKALERAGFDYLMIEDSSCVPDVFGGTMESVLRNAHGAPKNDPMTLVPLIGAATSRIGVVITAASTFYPPYLLARLAASLDHLTNGRMGVNVVTASNARAGQNYGLSAMPEHDERYRIAAEWLEVVNKLWGSWDSDAVVLDEERGVFADYTKVHPIDHHGQYFDVRGPLQTILSPQGRPVICQAGGSPAGRDFAAKHADTIVTGVNGVEQMKAYREDLSNRMAGFGRKPSDCKVLYLITPVLGETDAEAHEKQARIKQWRQDNVEFTLQTMSYASGVDFSVFPLDEPLPEVDTNGHRTTVSEFARAANGKTLREAAGYRQMESVDLVGTPTSVAVQMGEVMDEVGGDGYLLCNPLYRRSVSEIADGLVPALQKRGLTRTEYSHSTLRENLLAF